MWQAGDLLGDPRACLRAAPSLPSLVPLAGLGDPYTRSLEVPLVPGCGHHRHRSRSRWPWACPAPQDSGSLDLAGLSAAVSPSIYRIHSRSPAMSYWMNRLCPDGPIQPGGLCAASHNTWKNKSQEGLS